MDAQQSNATDDLSTFGGLPILRAKRAPSPAKGADNPDPAPALAPRPRAWIQGPAVTAPLALEQSSEKA